MLTTDKSKSQDKVFLFVLAIAAMLFLYLLYLSLWWILFSPFYLYMAMQLASFCATGHGIADPNKDVITLNTNLFNVGENLIPCQILLYPDKLLVTTKDSKATSEQIIQRFHENKANGVTLSFRTKVDVLVPIANITSILFEDKSSQHLENGGFGIEFEDEEGSGTIMCHNSGYGSIKKTRKQIAYLKEICDNYSKNTVEVIDFPAIRNLIASEVIHRQK